MQTNKTPVITDAQIAKEAREQLDAKVGQSDILTILYYKDTAHVYRYADGYKSRREEITPLLAIGAMYPRMGGGIAKSPIEVILALYAICGRLGTNGNVAVLHFGASNSHLERSPWKVSAEGWYL